MKDTFTDPKIYYKYLRLVVACLVTKDDKIIPKSKEKLIMYAKKLTSDFKVDRYYTRISNLKYKFE